MFQSKTFIVLLLLSLCVHPGGNRSCCADVPSETFYLSREEIHPDALIGVNGMLSVVFKDGWLVSQREPVRIQVYEHIPKDGWRASPSSIDLESLHTISGVDYGDELVIRRFPVSECQGRYVRIIYDVVNNLRAWVLLPEPFTIKLINGHLAKATLVWFPDYDEAESSGWHRHSSRPKVEWSGVDLFHLAPQPSIPLYESPSHTAPSIAVSPSTDHLYASCADNDFSGFIIKKRIHEFVQLSCRTPEDDSEVVVTLGWVRLYDEQGRLLLWEARYWP